MAEKTTKRSSLQFPIIPPLPSSKGLTDKENSSETPFRSKLPIGTPRSRRKPLQENGNDIFRNPASQSSQHSRGRVLRTAETMESLFCLSVGTSQEHFQLCRQIVDGPLSNDASAWCRAVEVACTQVAISRMDGKPIACSDLMRLHRRAKARFSLLDNKSKNEEGQVLRIWLSYAEAQARYASPEEARATYRFIQNQSFGIKLAAFYVSLAKFEKNFDQSRAVEIVKSGIETGAEPVEVLRSALVELSGSDECPVGLLKIESLTKISLSLSPLQDSTKRVSLFPSLPYTKKHRGDPLDTSPKRQKIEQKTEATCSNHLLDNSNMSTGTVSLSLQNVSQERTRASDHTPSIGATNDVEPNRVAQLDAKMSEPESHEQVSTESVKTLKTDVLTHIPISKSRNKLSSKVARLKSIGLTGGAKRLTPEEVKMDDSDDETEPVLMHSTKEKAEKENTNCKPASKLSRIDLSYMMNWDPSRRGSLISANPSGDQTRTLNTGTAVTTKSREPTMGTVVEATEVGSKLSVVTSSSHATSTASNHTGRTSRSHETCDLDVQSDLTCKETRHDAKKTTASRSSVPETARMLAQCNADFLPLVNENNIIRVNDVPFVKLGVIGKGGSSKVYRVLSKSCCVLAIKKVKLGNLDQKAIDGYANEIALLKKLQGNPSIIQMHDSEIDLNRKAIFLAMEVGEVDLNHVLQQQTLQSARIGNGDQPSLNMNFIRLTWQQMLSAVHSIHEERIIHSDLKPANFLFVRGALKLIDFGIAKAIQADDTTNIYRDSQIGTLNYMSPEAILDTGSGDGGARMRIGRASDIWSLGCILYQMVFGRTPFASLHMIQKLQAIVNPAYKIEFPGGADEAAVDAIKLCLRRKPDDRPPIIGKGGLLNEHYFLNHNRAPKGP